MITIKTPTREDVAYVAEHLRAIDEEEIEAVSAYSAKRSVLLTLDLCPSALAAYSNGVPFFIFGVRWSLCGLGTVFAFGTDDAKRHVRTFGYYAKRFVDDWAKEGPLFNYCSEANRRWLETLGFTVSKTPRIFKNKPLYFFEREADNV